jgi:hypothetical protein
MVAGERSSGLAPRRVERVDLHREVCLILESGEQGPQEFRKLPLLGPTERLEKLSLVLGVGCDRRLDDAEPVGRELDEDASTVLGIR